MIVSVKTGWGRFGEVSRQVLSKPRKGRKNERRTKKRLNNTANFHPNTLGMHRNQVASDGRNRAVTVHLGD